MPDAPPGRAPAMLTREGYERQLKMAEQVAAMQKTMTRLTWAITGLTAVNTVLVAVSVL